MKEDMETLGGRPRWVPYDKNPADALTKFEGAHFAPLAKLLKSSRFCIKEEADELVERKQTKETLGYVPRPRSPTERTRHAWKDPKRLASRFEEEADKIRLFCVFYLYI